MEYLEFLRAKMTLAKRNGFDISPDDVHPLLKPHQRDIVVWAIAGGQRAIFAAFGLGKTLIQIEIARIILEHKGGCGLIVCPLGVRQEFIRDAKMIGVSITFVRTDDEIAHDGLYLTNYESVREGKINPKGMTVICLDEAKYLAGFGGSKTFRRFMDLFEFTSTYRFVLTATPDPNETLELLAYSAFLGINDVGEMKTRFFKRDSTKADQLTLFSHREAEFWLWISSWAIFLEKPSDLGHDDSGYTLPPITINWHEVPTDHSKSRMDANGQGVMFKDKVYGLSEAAREKRDSLSCRIGKMLEIIKASSEDHFVIWHDLEAERHAIKKALPECTTVYGTQDLDVREKAIIDFADGRIKYVATKPQMYSAGVNLQRHCHREIFLGIGYKFADLIQAIARCFRFLQTEPVVIDLIYTEAETSVRAVLETKWEAYKTQVAKMSDIIREHGLACISTEETLKRTIGVERKEFVGEQFKVIQNDCVLETENMEANSVDLIITSIPFAFMYEYSPSYNDFGNTESNAHFWQQMDYLSPSLYRILAPGRVMAIHVKDRIVPGGLTGLGFQTLHPFHAEAIFHYQKHGFAFLGMKTVVTDVVRENNQTYRLGWTEQCKDGSRMGCGVPEYVLLFRKTPTDRSNGYADKPVVKHKPKSELPDGTITDYDYDGGKIVPDSGYSRSRWQLDAHGFMRSSGNRLLTPDELVNLPHKNIFRKWREESLSTVYDFDHHVANGEVMEREKRLPATFMVMPPHSWHSDVWTDVARMRTLNMEQERRGQELHLCCFQLDIVNRLIVQFSEEGETVMDPFGGLQSVPYCAIKLRRRGLGVELNATYAADGAKYCRMAEANQLVPTLFDMAEEEFPDEKESVSVDREA